MLTDATKQALIAGGAWQSELDAMEKCVRTSSVFCYAEPHANRFYGVANAGTTAELVLLLTNMLDGLRGWKGDTAKSTKAEVRRWIKRNARRLP
jgi:hypothetical protein